MRRIFERLISMIHKYRLRFFFLQPGSGRKARIFEGMLQHYIPQLRGQWSYQKVDGYYYFTRINNPHLN